MRGAQSILIRADLLITASVCIANYNYCDYVGDAIESCLAQSYGSVEVVVVDDGSTDASVSAISKFRDHIIFETQDNAGQFKAVRRAFNLSHGELVFFLDADDLLDPTTIERAVEAYEANPDASRIQWRLRIITASGDPTIETYPARSWKLADGDLRDHVLRRRNYIWPPTSGNSYPRRVLDLVFSSIIEETSFIDLVLAETTPLLGPIVTLPGEGGSYRWHGKNQSLLAKDAAVDYLHDRILEIESDHKVVRRLCEKVGIKGCPSDASEALDWAFAGYRLASLRLDPGSHPIPTDRTHAVMARGVKAVVTQPGYSIMAKIKRTVWFILTGVAPAPIAQRLIRRAFLSPPTNPTTLNSREV